MIAASRLLAIGAAGATALGGTVAGVVTTPFSGNVAAAETAGVAAADTSSPSATDEAACSSGQLPGYVIGRPERLAPGASAGDYVWHNDRGWNIAVTHPGNGRHVFTGTVRTSRPIEFVEVRDEKHDVVSLSGDRMTMTFRFTNYGHLDGVRFRVRCARTVRLSLAADGHELSPTGVFLGTNGRHPSSNPFAVERR
jgi:hypothetical protein